MNVIPTRPRLRQGLAALALAALALPALARGAPANPADPHGIVVKPIPDKLVVLTFDDACLSHATFVAPLLNKLGFGATFYITRFGNPAPDPSRYMSWEQIKGLETMGFEIANHTWSHSQLGGGQANVAGQLPDIVKMEDQLLANKLARPTTFCWPIYTVNPAMFPVLLDKGYLFGRSGGRNDRPYTPTVDNPFETPSFTIMANTPVATFTGAAQRAVRGRVPIYTFHGVPDIEHPGVGVEPARFEEMMRFLKDHHYTVIAMRDLAGYVDSKMAQQYLPVPMVPPDITLTDAAQLAASQTLRSPKLVCELKVAGTQVTFGGTGTGRVAVPATLGGKLSLIHGAPWLLELLPNKEAAGNDLAGVTVAGSHLQSSPQGLNGSALTLRDATLLLADPLNTWKDFASPVTLAGANTIRALDSNRAVLTGKMTGGGSVTYVGFYPLGRVSSDSDYTGDTRIAQDEWFGQNPDDRQGHDDFMFGISGTRPFGTGVVTIAGKVGTRMGRAWFGGNDNRIPNALKLETALIVIPNINLDLSGNISGPGGLVRVFSAENPGDTLKLSGDNSFSGGTRFFAGTLLVGHARALGSGPVVLGGMSADPKHVVRLANASAMTVANAMQLAGITDATVDGTCPTFAGRRGKAANDPAAATEFNTAGGDLTITGAISGSGGLLKTGPNALVLSGTNTYAGPTTVKQGLLTLANARSLGPNAELSIGSGAALVLNFTGEMKIRKLILDGKPQPAGAYREKDAPGIIQGAGVLRVLP